MGDCSLRPLVTRSRECKLARLCTRRAVPTRGAVAVWATVLVRHNVETGQVAHVHGAKHVLGVGIDLDALLDLEVHGGDVRDVVETLLTLLLLELQGDTLHGSTRDALHHVGGEPRDLVAETLGGDQSTSSQMRLLVAKS